LCAGEGQLGVVPSARAEPSPEERPRDAADAQHVGVGVGEDFCLGANLAKLEAKFRAARRSELKPLWRDEHE
jgi:hypothetical protein